MPCREIGPTIVQHFCDYNDDGSSGKTMDSDSDCSGHDETTAVVRTCGRGKWLKTLRTVIGRMEGDGGRRPRQVKTILRPPTTYVFVIGMSGLPSKVAVYPRRT
jgi:hypothetical protein